VYDAAGAEALKADDADASDMELLIADAC